MSILNVKNLAKSFKKNIAVNGISFSIKKGSIVGLLGPNGAGKSTTIEMILGLIKPTSGTIEVFGKNIEAHREEVLSRINYSSTYIQFMSRLTVYENLDVFARLYNVKNRAQKIEAVSDELKLESLLQTLFFKLSSGQKTRVILAKTLLNDPEFLLLDEPTASLDPDIAYKVRELLKNIHKNRGVTMLYTSHNMAEVEEMCEDIIFLQKGKIVAQGTPDELKRMVRDYYVELSFDFEKETQMASFLDRRQSEFEFKSKGHVYIKTTAQDMPHLLQEVSREDFGIYDIDINKPDLEEVFLKIARS